MNPTKRNLDPRTELADQFLMDLLSVWKNQHGKEALRRLDAAQLATLIASVIDREARR
jgi:hypothetical protein